MTSGWRIIGIVIGAAVVGALCAGPGWHGYRDHLRLHALEQSVAGTFNQIQVGAGGILRVVPTSTPEATASTPTTTTPESTVSTTTLRK